jgi:hypothetical protein
MRDELFSRRPFATPKAKILALDVGELGLDLCQRRRKSTRNFLTELYYG